MDAAQHQNLLKHAEELLKELLLRTSTSPKLDEMKYYDTFVAVMERLYAAEFKTEELENDISNLELQREDLLAENEDLETDVLRLKERLSDINTER